MILETALKNLCVGVKVGGSIVSHRPIFSRDTKSIYVVSSNTIFLYNTSTCLCTGRIRTPNAETISNISLAPLSQTNSLTLETLFILTTNGSLFQIDPSTQKVLLQANLNQSIPTIWKSIGIWLNILCVKTDTFLIVGVPQDSQEALLYLATRVEDKYEGKNRRVVIFNLEKICWKIIHHSHSVASGVNGDLVAAVQEDSVFMTSIVSGAAKWHKSGSRNFTCVACHPEEWIVATGDDSGRIVLWRNFLEEKSPAKTVFHWHTLPVGDLCFTVDGSHMFSGAGECTLVKWDITHTDNKRTLPRMGLPIRHVNVSSANSLIATSHADNCIQLVDSQNNIIGSIQNITQCYLPEIAMGESISDTSIGGSTVFQAGLHLDPRNHSLVMNGKPGHLQCYSYNEDKHLYTLDITQQNFVTSERHKTISNSEVCHITFSKQGSWLATAESLVDLSNGKCIELGLKFWKFETIKQIFILNTTIHWPHENGIVSLKIQPIDDDDLSIMAASSGKDNKFKTWGIVSDHSLHGKDEWWSCENIGTYRDLPTGPLAFSKDGSVLTAAFGHVLTLWTCENHQMKGALSHTRLQENILLLEFGGQLCSHLVICSTTQNLVVWDVITLSLLWAVPFKATSISVDPLSNIVAAFSTKNHVYFFQPDSPEPLAHHNNISRSKVISSSFVPNSSTADFSALKSTLMFINSSQELCALISKKDGTDLPEIVRVNSNNSSSTLTPFAQLIAEKSVSDIANSSQNTHLNGWKIGRPGCQVIRDIMDASPHTMPSVTFFCDQLLSSVSTPRSVSEKLDNMEQHMTNSFKMLTENSHQGKKVKQIPKVEILQIEPSIKPEIRKTFLINLDEIMNEDTTWIRSVFNNP